MGVKMGKKHRKNTPKWGVFVFGADEGKQHSTIYCIFIVYKTTIYSIIFILGTF